jgi:predicted glutamine amidotransferase
VLFRIASETAFRFVSFRFAEVSASPGSAINRENCHPFNYKNFTFMHNGGVSNFQTIKRKLRNELDEALYNVSRHKRTNTRAVMC